MSQNERILEALRHRGEGGLTPGDALDMIGTFRLAARISDLRSEGHDIETQRIGRKRFARYVLREPLTLW